MALGWKLFIGLFMDFYPAFLSQSLTYFFLAWKIKARIIWILAKKKKKFKTL